MLVFWYFFSPPSFVCMDFFNIEMQNLEVCVSTRSTKRKVPGELSGTLQICSIRTELSNHWIDIGYIFYLGRFSKKTWPAVSSDSKDNSILILFFPGHLIMWRGKHEFLVVTLGEFTLRQGFLLVLMKFLDYLGWTKPNLSDFSVWYDQPVLKDTNVPTFLDLKNAISRWRFICCRVLNTAKATSPDTRGLLRWCVCRRCLLRMWRA